MGKILTDYEIIAWATGEACDVTSTDIAVSHQLLRGLLRRVMDCHVYSEGEGSGTVRGLMLTSNDDSAALLAEVKAAVEGGR